jgi:hypothetical protein
MRWWVYTASMTSVTFLLVIVRSLEAESRRRRSWTSSMVVGDVAFCSSLLSWFYRLRRGQGKSENGHSPVLLTPALAFVPIIHVQRETESRRAYSVRAVSSVFGPTSPSAPPNIFFLQRDACECNIRKHLRPNAQVPGYGHAANLERQKGSPARSPRVTAESGGRKA